MYKKFYKELKEQRPSWNITHRDGTSGAINMNNSIARTLVGIMTCGITEAEVQVQNASYRKKARTHVDKIDILRNDLINEKYREEAEAASIRAKEAANEVEYIKNLNEIKDKQLNPLFVDLIQREREGRPSDVPNCLMISCGNESVNKDLVNWTGRNTNARFLSIEHNANLLEELELAEKNFHNTGDWNLIHIKNGDKLINTSFTDFSDIEAMKDIMSSTAEDYHTTLLFDSTKPHELDSIAMQPHRVRQITGNIKSLEEMNIDSALTRLNLKRAIDCPINTVNDLITVCRLKLQKLSIGYICRGVAEAEEAITAALKSADKSELLEILAKAAHKLKI